MWEMGIMKKWVEDFASCEEELLYGVLEKVNLVIRNQEKGLEKGSHLVQKKVERPKDSGTLKTLMSGGGGGKVKIELKKVNKGGGEQKIKSNGWQEKVKHKKKLDNAQKRTRILRVYNETKTINGGKF